MSLSWLLEESVWWSVKRLGSSSHSATLDLGYFGQVTNVPSLYSLTCTRKVGMIVIFKSSPHPPFFFPCTRSIWKLPGQGLNLSHSCDLRHSCGNAGSFNPLHCAWDRTPHLHSDLSCYNQILNPLCHSRNSSICIFIITDLKSLTAHAIISVILGPLLLTDFSSGYSSRFPVWGYVL